MPKRHRTNKSPFKSNSGHTQSERSSASSQGALRALPAVPGRIPLREEAELLVGVTKASAKPDTGATLFGPSHIASKPLDFSLVPPEVDDRNSRARGMGHKPDGDSHPSSISTYPLRTNCNNEEPLLMSAASPSGDTPTERPFVLANSGFDPTTNGFYGLSEVKLDERQEGAKERTTNTDPSETDPFYNSTFVDNNLSHQIYSLDKSYKIQTFPQVEN